MNWGPLSGVCAFTEGGGLISSILAFIANTRVTSGADTRVTSTGDIRVTKEAP